MKAVLLCLALLFFSACAPKSPQYIKDSQNYTSFGLDSHDIQTLVDSNIRSLSDSELVRNFNGKDKKVLALSNISNQTSEDIDMELLGRRLIRELRASKKFILSSAIAGSGGSTESMLDNSRKLDERFNPYTTQENGTLDAPEFALSGKLIERVKSIDSMLRVDYTLLLSLTDLKNGRVVWDNEASVSKVVDKRNAKRFSSKNNNTEPTLQEMIQACEDKDYEFCAKVGLHFYGSADFKQSAKYYEYACNGNLALGCLNLGIMYEEGKGVPQNHRKSIAYLAQACINGEVIGCAAAGYLYRDILHDYDEAFRYNKLACTGGMAPSCTSVGLAYHEGQGAPQSYAKAAGYYRQSCNANDSEGCLLLGALYKEGNGVEKNTNFAYTLFKKACNLGSDTGCTMLQK